MGVLVDGLLGRYSGLAESKIPAPPEWLALVLHGITRSRVLRFLDDNGITARITSGYRDPARNEKVGGAANSAHLHGLGVDLVPSGNWQNVAALWRKETGGTAIVEPDHVHLNLPRSWGWVIVRRFMLVLVIGVVLVFLMLSKVVSHGRKKNGRR